jgi:hypothetical protein
MGAQAWLQSLSRRYLWALVNLELRRWNVRGHRPRFWWRDDDARAPTPALFRMLALSELHKAPLAIAIIPDGDLAAIGEVIQGHPLVSAIQHGCDHVDRNQGGGYSAEFAPAQHPEEVSKAISQAWRRLSAALSATPVYAPPWNVLTPNVAVALRATPFKAVSTYGAAGPAPEGLAEVNAHIDIMRWRPARFRGETEIMRRLLRLLQQRRRSGRWTEPIGLLTHHKNLDEPAWRFLDSFLGRLASEHGQTGWFAIGDLNASA